MTEIFYKHNAAVQLLAEWEKKGYECKPITIGANTDPYQPIERRFGLTRRVLELCLEVRQPVTVTTKSALVERDGGAEELPIDRIVVETVGVGQVEVDVAGAADSTVVVVTPAVVAAVAPSSLASPHAATTSANASSSSIQARLLVNMDVDPPLDEQRSAGRERPIGREGTRVR